MTRDPSRGHTPPGIQWVKADLRGYFDPMSRAIFTAGLNCTWSRALVLRRSSVAKRSTSGVGRYWTPTAETGNGLAQADLPHAETMNAKFFYAGIRVKDLEASVKFYTTVLGMKVRGRNTVDAAKGTVVELVCEEEGGNTLELNYYEKGGPFDTKYEVGEGLDHLAFAVEDLDAALAEAKKAGHPVVLKMQEPGSRYAYIHDPNGIWIELAQFG